jgi:hypothetical protein
MQKASSPSFCKTFEHVFATAAVGGSLVGRGIANPEDEIDEIQGKYKGEKRGEWEFRSILQNFEPTCPFGHEVSNFREKELENHLKLQKTFNYKQIFRYTEVIFLKLIKKE